MLEKKVWEGQTNDVNIGEGGVIGLWVEIVTKVRGEKDSKACG